MSKKMPTILLMMLLLILAITLFRLIYIYFQLDLSLPPEPELSKSDWLEFLGSYLGFASSTLFAIAVFCQDQKINTLISDEYNPILKLKVADFERLDEAAKNNSSRYIILEREQRKLLFEQFIYDPIKIKPEYGDDYVPFRFYITINSQGKLPVHSLSITKIIMDDNICVYEKDIEKKQLITDEIQPDGVFNLCLKLNSFPQLHGNDVHILYIYYNVKITRNAIYKSCFKLLLTGDEKTVYDGFDYISK